MLPSCSVPAFPLRGSLATTGCSIRSLKMTMTTASSLASSLSVLASANHHALVSSDVDPYRVNKELCLDWPADEVGILMRTDSGRALTSSMGSKALFRVYRIIQTRGLLELTCRLPANECLPDGVTRTPSSSKGTWRASTMSYHRLFIVDLTSGTLLLGTLREMH